MTTLTCKIDTNTVERLIESSKVLREENLLEVYSQEQTTEAEKEYQKLLFIINSLEAIIGEIRASQV